MAVRQPLAVTVLHACCHCFVVSGHTRAAWFFKHNKDCEQSLLTGKSIQASKVGRWCMQDAIEDPQALMQVLVSSLISLLDESRHNRSYSQAHIISSEACRVHNSVSLGFIHGRPSLLTTSAPDCLMHCSQPSCLWRQLMLNEHIWTLL